MGYCGLIAKCKEIAAKFEFRANCLEILIKYDKMCRVFVWIKVYKTENRHVSQRET